LQLSLYLEKLEEATAERIMTEYTTVFSRENNSYVGPRMDEPGVTSLFTSGNQARPGAVGGASDIMAAACHEIRTPVAALHATVEVLTDYATLSAAEIGDLVGRLQRGLTWLEGMVENLTASAVADSGHVALRREDVVQVMECVETAVNVVEPLALGRRQRISVSSESDGASVRAGDGDVGGSSVYGDGGKITQALINLLMNGCSYTPDGGAIAVSVRTAGGDVEVRVTDTGPGVNEAERAQIFHRYTRGRAGASRSAGLGLGLHIVKTLIEQQGGCVGVESPPGCGASFWFTLRRALGDAQPRRAVHAVHAVPGPTQRAGTGPAASRRAAA
jgi:signal transduction histidine kinase